MMKNIASIAWKIGAVLLLVILCVVCFSWCSAPNAFAQTNTVPFMPPSEPPLPIAYTNEQGELAWSDGSAGPESWLYIYRVDYQTNRHERIIETAFVRITNNVSLPIRGLVVEIETCTNLTAGAWIPTGYQLHHSIGEFDEPEKYYRAVLRFTN
jgi:hypothetical protein